MNLHQPLPTVIPPAGLPTHHYVATIFTNIAALLIAIGPWLETGLKILLLTLSCALTIKQLCARPRKGHQHQTSRNAKLLNLAGGFLLIAFCCCACSSLDHALLTPDFTPKPGLTNLLGNITKGIAATAPFNPYAQVIALSGGFASAALGWYAHIRAKNKHMDTQTAHIATLNTVLTSNKIPVPPMVKPA